jgi:hypothetical protein
MHHQAGTAHHVATREYLRIAGLEGVFAVLFAGERQALRTGADARRGQPVRRVG